MCVYFFRFRPTYISIRMNANDKHNHSHFGNLSVWKNDNNNKNVVSMLPNLRMRHNLLCITKHLGIRHTHTRTHSQTNEKRRRRCRKKNERITISYYLIYSALSCVNTATIFVSENGENKVIMKSGLFPW